MTQEEKDLLLKDLCGRLPYGVKCAEVYPDSKFINKWDILKINKFIENGIFISNSEEIYGYVSQIENIKPYLFPLSSMDKKQRKYIRDNYTFGATYELFDWFDKNHFDYRGLIEKGLAINAKGLNIY